MKMNDVIGSNQVALAVYDLIRKINHNMSRKSIDVKEKGTADFVTSIDLWIEQALMKGLREIEDIPCLTEESNQSVDSSNYWVIDPIDGTTNLVHGYPCYCISIAKVKDNVTECGFVYNLANKDLFIGIAGQGAYMMNTRVGKVEEVHVSKRERIQDALIAFGCPYDKSKTERLFEIIKKLIRVCHDVKRNGPSSLDLCYVASGRTDAYFEFDLKEWDYKAGKLILELAGGQITNWSGEAIGKGASNIAASNGLVHAELLEYLK